MGTQKNQLTEMYASKEYCKKCVKKYLQLTKESWKNTQIAKS